MTAKKFMRAVITLALMSGVIFAIKVFSKNVDGSSSFPSRAIKIIVPFKVLLTFVCFNHRYLNAVMDLTP